MSEDFVWACGYTSRAASAGLVLGWDRGDGPKRAPGASEDGLDDLCHAVDQFTNFFYGRLCRISMAAFVSKIAEELDVAGLRQLDDVGSFQRVVEDGDCAGLFR
jgi:hypothetical protein